MFKSEEFMIAMGALVTASITFAAIQLFGKRLALRKRRMAVIVCASAVPSMIFLSGLIYLILNSAPPESDIVAVAFFGCIMVAVFAFCVSYPLSLWLLPPADGIGVLTSENSTADL